MFISKFKILYASEIEIDDEENSPVILSLSPNHDPEITITNPETGIKTYLDQPLNLSALTSDQDPGHASSLIVNWFISAVGESTIIQIGSEREMVYYPSEAGSFVLSVNARDISGGTAESSVIIEVLQPDNDLDFIDTCPISGDNPWFDPVELRSCGPDQFDDDDDNDGLSDSSDDFPFDSCAWQDTDKDGRPDLLEQNCSTSLIEDLDDDNDGLSDDVDNDPKVPYIADSNADDEALIVTLLSPGVIIPLIVIVVATFLLYRQRQKTED